MECLTQPLGSTCKHPRKCKFSFMYANGGDSCLFFTQQYYCYGAILFSQFSEFFLYSDSHLLRSIAQHHSAICFSFLMATLVAFVGTLRGNAYLQQFQYLTWTVMTLVTVMPSNFHVSNILQGLFWYVWWLGSRGRRFVLTRGV